jgi:DNA-binding transcriptional ArsR family regulator
MEEQKDSIDKSEDLTVRLGHFVEVLDTDDERLTVIGEELSNETGRAILANLFKGVTTVSEIASSLNVSIPLVRWHIQRLSKVQLISVTQTKLSKKNKRVQHYAPNKFALIIVPSKIMQSSVYSELLKSSLKKIYKSIPMFIAFVGSTAALYLLKIGSQQDGTSFKLVTPDGMQPLIISSDLGVALVGGIGVAFATWLLFKLWNSKKTPLAGFPV